MDIFFNTNPEFTRWIVSSGALREPFVVIDVGVLGGENPRWHFLGDHLVVHGFDAIREVVDELTARNSNASNKRYHWLAIGDEDGEREFFFKPSNPTNSSFYRVPDPELQSRTVPVRRLDSLLEEGAIPGADFLKVDVEGFEGSVLLGAAKLLASGVLGVESETNFSTSPIYPKTHFGLIQEVLLQQGMFVLDINFNRVPRAAYQEARKHRNLPQIPAEGSGKPATLNVLFCRDLTAERDGSLYYPRVPPPPSIDQILKAMSIYELHGLNDIAIDTAVKFSAELGHRLDVDRAVGLLCRRSNLVQIESEAVDESIWTPEQKYAAFQQGMASLERERDQLAAQVSQMLGSTSWRMTAPLRSIVDRFRQAMR